MPQAKCGFQKVSTDFAVNYVRDQFIKNQLTQTNIGSEQECISGTPSVSGFINPNLQSGAQDALDPQIYQSGIVRVCATSNPGGPGEDSRWIDVGNCGDERIKCYLDEDSIDRSLSVGNEITRQTTREDLNLIAERTGIIDEFKLWIIELREQFRKLRAGGSDSEQITLANSILKHVRDIRTEAQEPDSPGIILDIDEVVLDIVEIEATKEIVKQEIIQKQVLSLESIEPEDEILDLESFEVSTDSTRDATDVEKLQQRMREVGFDRCEQYAEDILRISEEEGIDELLITAIIMQESSCNSNAVKGNSFGLMGITEGAFDQFCSGKIDGVADSFDLIGPSSITAVKNIQCGAKVLKGKYNLFNQGTCLVNDDCRHPFASQPSSLSATVDCIEFADPPYCNYIYDCDLRNTELYSSWDAALRAYNGWDCKGDNFYVENVNDKYESLQRVSVSNIITVSSSGSASSGNEEDIRQFLESEGIKIAQDANLFTLSDEHILTLGLIGQVTKDKRSEEVEVTKFEDGVVFMNIDDVFFDTSCPTGLSPDSITGYEILQDCSGELDKFFTSAVEFNDLTFFDFSSIEEYEVVIDSGKVNQYWRSIAPGQLTFENIKLYFGEDFQISVETEEIIVYFASFNGELTLEELERREVAIRGLLENEGISINRGAIYQPDISTFSNNCQDQVKQFTVGIDCQGTCIAGLTDDTVISLLKFVRSDRIQNSLGIEISGAAETFNRFGCPVHDTDSGHHQGWKVDISYPNNVVNIAKQNYDNGDSNFGINYGINLNSIERFSLEPANNPNHFDIKFAQTGGKIPYSINYASWNPDEVLV